MHNFIFTTFPLLTDDDKWQIIRRYSEELKRYCDWTQLPDSGLSISKRLEWQAYRDALRSIQDDFSNPDDAIFPELPTEEE